MKKIQLFLLQGLLSSVPVLLPDMAITVHFGLQPIGRVYPL